MKLLALAAATLSLLPIAAQAETSPQITFAHQGARYTYTVTQDGSTRTIKGWEEVSKTPFLLRVTKSRVTGTFGDSPVEFSRKSVKPLTGTVEVAVK